MLLLWICIICTFTGIIISLIGLKRMPADQRRAQRFRFFLAMTGPGSTAIKIGTSLIIASAMCELLHHLP